MPRVFPSTNPACPDDIRAAGWVVAVHNDYRLGGILHTFWLFTKDDAKDRPEPGEGRYAKGEGESDAVALNRVRSMIGLPILPPVAGEYTATFCDAPYPRERGPTAVEQIAGGLAEVIGQRTQDLTSHDTIEVYRSLIRALMKAIAVEQAECPPSAQPKE